MMENYPVKLFIKDVLELNKTNGEEYKLYNMKFNTIETHGIVSYINDYRSVEFILSDYTGSLEVSCGDANKRHESLHSLKNEISQLHTSANKSIMKLLLSSLDCNLKVGDFVTIIGKFPGDNESENNFVAHHYYTTSMDSSFIWNEHVMNLYQKHYKT